MSIKVLDENTISKIAAGEVVENPASVVKELVENSIDAGAKNVTIDIKEGGTKQIKVSDDGSGFEKDDLGLAFVQHATSKLSNIDDLNNIFSYGFRGEALASISAVSRVTLITKRDDANAFGYKYVIDFGKESKIEEVAANRGTSIEVNDLFANVPVRKKFLKGLPKENALVEDIVIKFAIIRPDIAFKLVIDDKVKFSSSGDNNLLSVIYKLYGREVIDNLVEIKEEINGINVDGYIANPACARNTRNDEIYFVNDRYIKNKTISRAVEDAYEGFMMQHKYPLVVLKIQIDNSKVDVNVHPKKSEVRFSSDDYVYYAIYNAIKNTIHSLSLIHEEKIEDARDNDRLEYRLDLDYNIDSDSENEKNDSVTIEKNINYGGEELIDESKIDKITIDELPSIKDILHKKLNSGYNLTNFYNKLEANHKFEEKPFIQKTLSEDHKYIGQIFGTYVLVEFEDKLYIIDQHAAHEKINFENIMSMYKNGNVSSQKIIPSIIMKLTPIQYEAVASNIESFEKTGFEIELFGDNDIKVDAVPYNIFNIGNEKLLLDIIDSFADSKNKEQYDSIAEKIASIACKKSIKANYILSTEEVKQLLRDLFKLDNPYNCPHGRPTIISFSKSEFEKRFGRIV